MTNEGITGKQERRERMEESGRDAENDRKKIDNSSIKFRNLKEKRKMRL